ncbi:MAG TPA: AgmX/PglI C-terminal domain-containing protein [Kofleriaceae bacterium]|nr:AgmX/PglI C-terminal domain-containing protein [Kofleriaceae bacterium]
MRNSLAFVLTAGLVACGGSTKGPENPSGGGGGGGGGGGAKPSGPGDVSFEVPTIQVNGVLFEPEALGSPGMPLAYPKKKTTTDKQRQTYDKAAKGKDVVQRQAQAAVLATLIYDDAKKAKDEAEKQKMWSEARGVLRDSVTAAGEGKGDPTDLRMLGSFELLLEDYAGAEKAWSALVASDPKDKELPTFKAWWAYALLRQYKSADALNVIANEQITDKTPELAYVMAWAKFRTGDDKGAWQAISLAAKGGTSLFPHDPLLRDMLLFAGRTGASIDEAVASLQPVFGKAQQYELLAKLGLESYQYAGRWQDGVMVLEKAVTASGGKVPVNDMPVLRFEQADYTVRLDDPVASAKFGKLAVDALPACGAKCPPQDMATIVYSVYLMGQLFHVLYATAHDDRYYQPAHDLYQATVSKLTDDKQRGDAQKNADALERSFKAMKAGVGTHSKDAIAALLNRHNQEIQACFERGLAANPKLSGTVTLNLESDQTGAIKGASTEPKAGTEGMSMVAGCVETHAKAWKLPKRAQAGSTRIKMSYSMSVAAKK